MVSQTLEVKSLGALGDGIAANGVFVPGALPGDVVEANVEKGRASVRTWQIKSDLHVTPVCKHFGDCGGCKMQHLDMAAYSAWKASLVSDALSQEGIHIDLQPMVTCEPNSRRRAVFSVVVKDEGVDVGFQRAGSNHVVAIEECHVITERLAGATQTIGQLAKTFQPRGKTASFTVLDTRTGFDVSVSGDYKLKDNDRRAISAFAVKTKLARVTVNGETIIENNRPMLSLSGFDVAPPAGGFVQAVQTIEDVMVQLVCDHLSKCKRIADIFSGSGTFTLPLARIGSVVAAEGEAAALNALDRAWREAAGKGLKPLKTEKRDLHHRPFMAKELELMKTQGAVFDPPRAGAEMQAKELAKSKVKRIAAVSCNPTTLARDLRILIDGGYTLQSVTPLDQFLWSPHVEAVALLVRGKG
ncbi:RNA methyltransferase [Ahrensia kielensis]|uniref:RNA methyltransferase n=1 Tax=Ahrensia kielensis TaxID=76980 RepID=A0ABU9T7S6_9HYPH